MLKTPLIIICVGLLLAECTNVNRTAEYYMEHSRKIFYMIEKCMRMPLAESRANSNCTQANIAINNLIREKEINNLIREKEINDLIREKD